MEGHYRHHRHLEAYLGEGLQASLMVREAYSPLFGCSLKVFITPMCRLEETSGLLGDVNMSKLDVTLCGDQSDNHLGKAAEGAASLLNPLQGLQTSSCRLHDKPLDAHTAL